MQRSYVIYGSMRWNGPWAVDHNIAHALAARHPVLYVDPPLSPATPLRYGLTSASRGQLLDVVDRRARRSGRLSHFTPLALPPLSAPRMRGVSLPWVRGQIRRAVQRAGLDAPVVVGCRSYSDVAGAAGESLRVGMVMDHLAAGATLVARNRADLERELRETCAVSDIICVPGTALQSLLDGAGWKSELLPWGFAADLVADYEAAGEPPEYAGFPRPLLGYTGSIDDRLDYELILRLADRFAQGTIVFIGAVSPRLSAAARTALQSRANIRLLGTRPRIRLPSYVRYLDCLLLPYADMEFTRYQSPMKLWDYLYAGPPIVGTGSVDLRRYQPPIVYFTDDPGAYPELVARAIAAGAMGAEQRRTFALANTWDARAAQLDDLVDRALPAHFATGGSQPDLQLLTTA